MNYASGDLWKDYLRLKQAYQDQYVTATAKRFRLGPPRGFQSRDVILGAAEQTNQTHGVVEHVVAYILVVVCFCVDIFLFQSSRKFQSRVAQHEKTSCY